MTACDGCLRRARLLGLLAPWIERSLAERKRLPSLLALDEHELLEAVCGAKRAAVESRLEAFDAEHVRREASGRGLAAVCRHDERYPRRLGEPADAPATLFALGEPAHLETLAEESTVAIVGSRRASPYGLEVARALASELATCGVPVVSGMARGADSAAHEGALAAGGLTVAVLAGGADVPYPRGKRRLHRAIAERGLVLSELPPGLHPFRWCFPARNRIMAGLAEMTVVVEGGDESGTLITARFAADLGREVGAVPGQVTAPLARGPNGLIADGACVVRSAADVLDALYGPEGRARLRERPRVELDPRLERLLAAVEEGGGGLEELARESPAADLLAALTELEMLGLVRRVAGGAYVRCA